MKLLEKLQNKELYKIFKKFEVETAYLFGSHAREKATSLSDVDIAVLLSDKVLDSKYFDMQLELTSALMTFFGKETVDVIILNNNYPVISFKAISGKLIYEKTRKKRVEFEINVRKRYFDTAHIRNVLNKAMKNRLAGW